MEVLVLIYLGLCVSGAIFTIPEYKRDLRFIIKHKEYLDRETRNYMRRLKMKFGDESFFKILACIYWVTGFLGEWVINPWTKVHWWWKGALLLYSAQDVANKVYQKEQ